MLNIVHRKSLSLPKPIAMVVRTIGSHQGLSQRRPEMILKENLHFLPLIELHLSSRFCNTFFVTTFAVYLPKELLSPAAATRAAACAGKFHYIHIFATTPCLCLCFYLSLSLTFQFCLFTYFRKNSLTLSVFLCLCWHAGLKTRFCKKTFFCP